MISGGVSSAASILAGNFVDISFSTPVLNGSQPLDGTYTAKVGVLAPGVVLTPTTTFAQIAPNWTNAGDIQFATGAAAGYNGFFDGEAVFTDALGIAGKNVFIWVTNGSGFNAILENTTVQFLADAAIPNANSITIESQFIADYQVRLGAFNPLANGGVGAFEVNSADPIPEPSAVLLGALGALGLLRRRRN